MAENKTNPKCSTNLSSRRLSYCDCEDKNEGLPICDDEYSWGPDHLEDGVKAVLTTPKPQSLSTCESRLLRDEVLQKQMACANRENVKDFAPDVVAPQYLDLLREITRERNIN